VFVLFLSQYTYFFPRKRFRNCLQSVKEINNNLIQNKGYRFIPPNQKTKYMNVRLLARRLKYAAILFVLPFFVNAQQKTVTGKVTSDKDGSAISGATVIAKGSTKGTQTSAEGNFTLEVPAATKTLVVSAVGSVTEQVSIGADNTASVSLKVGNEGLTEVVVVGYGSRKIKDATGSVASITAKDFNKGQISTPEQLFQGRTPGVTVTPSSGEPGAAATINIRGTSAIRGNQQPLYIVDGIPLDGGGTTTSSAGAEGTTTAKNPLSFINPNDIESISILKDASSAAIYGARGANGVVIITTKIGRGSKGAWNFGASTSLNSTASRYKLLNAEEFKAGLIAENVQLGTPVAAATANAQSLFKGSNTDWQDEIFRRTLSQTYNLSYGFSKKKTNLRVSGSYDDQQGIIKKSYLKRFTARANFSQTFLSNNALKLEVTTTYSNLNNSYVPNTNNAGYQGSLIGAALRFNPTFPVKDPVTGKYSLNGDLRNPAAMLDYTDDKDNINRVLASFALTYKIIDGLTFKTSVGIDNSKGQRTSFVDPRLENAGDNQTRLFGVSYGNGTQGNGRAAIANDKTRNIVFENFLTYNKVFNKKHDINAVLGASIQKSTLESDGTVYWDLVTPVSKPEDVFDKTITSFKKSWYLKVPNYERSDLNSAFTRINYTFNDKYLLTATARVDGSSKFGKNNRYGFFPAVGAKWRVMNENFASGLSNVFSDFSIRANYGIIGSQDGIGAYSAYEYYQRWITSDPNVTPVKYDLKIVNKGNDDLKWEEAATSSIALDWATKSRRLSGTIEFYNTNRKNLLAFGPTPGGFGGGANIFQNIDGIVNNKGLEFSLNYKIISSSKFSWDVSYNMTFMSNKVSGLPGQPLNTGEVNGPGLTGAFAQRIENGFSLYSWYMQQFTGFDAGGLPTYLKDDKGVPVVTTLNKSPLPTFNAGLTNNFSYGRWNASIFMNAATGFYIYNNTANGHFLAGILKNGGNVDKSVTSSAENPLAPATPSTRFLEKGDFLRIANALISYDFNIKNKVIKSLSVNLSGQNLALFTNYSGLDPEVNVDKTRNGVPSRGFDYASYPKARTFTLGFNVGF
jgi:TonB-dependent starch-binding outer membrane protein SusC